MKLQILHAPTVPLLTYILVSFKFGLQTPLCVNAATVNTFFVMPSRLLGLPPVLRLTIIKFTMVLHSLHK